MPGEDSQTISYQLIGQHTNGISKVGVGGLPSLVRAEPYYFG